MFGVKWKLFIGCAILLLNLHVEAKPSGSQKKKIHFEINSRHHLPTRNEKFNSDKSEDKDNLLTLTENVKNSPKNKIIRKSSKHKDVKSIKIKSLNSDMQPRRNKFKHRRRKYSQKDNLSE